MNIFKETHINCYLSAKIIKEITQIYIVPFLFQL